MYNTAKQWDTLPSVFIGASIIRLLQVWMRFDISKMDSKQSTTEHLRKMLTMTHDLNAADNILTTKQT